MSTFPLAHRLRPSSLSAYYGQTHLLGETGPVKGLIDSKIPKNIIFWGPPGVGKTSLSLLLKEAWGVEWYAINATLASISDIKKVIDSSRQNKLYGKTSLLFIDEIHRFSKTQQDALLSVVEDGTLTLIGATTENPRFSVIGGLVSRCLIFECKLLDESELRSIALSAFSLIETKQDISEELLKHLIHYSAGDARKLCNAIELISSQLSNGQTLSLELLSTVLPDAIRTLDDTTHYDLSSAMIKSLRGSDPDAALYWLSRLLVSGEDPVFIARRFVIFASEDIGNADPQALVVATAAIQATQFIGMPEARIVLGQIATYLATAPKSNASYVAIDAALSKVKKGDIQPVPAYLRTPQSQSVSHGASGHYLYPHDYPYGMVAQDYWDNSDVFYQPKPIGFEREIHKRLDWIKSKK